MTHILAWNASPLQQVKAVRAGLPSTALTTMSRDLGLVAEDLASLLHISRSTIQRRKTKQSRLKPDESERTLRLGAVFDHAVDVLGDKDSAREWFNEPRNELGGVTPLSLCDTEPGRVAVDQVLTRIEYGVFS